MRLIKQSIKRLIKKSPLVFSTDVKVETNNGSRFSGWVKASGSSIEFSTLKVYSSTDERIVVSNHYRPDIRRAGLHPSGYCGFDLDVSGWEDAAVKYELISNAKIVNYDLIDPVLFIHIPKTAGTSFRKSAVDFLGSDAIVRDYGIKSSETSLCVKEYCYQKNDFLGLHSFMKNHGKALYSGHIHIAPARFVFSSTSIMTFVRNPIEQVISHFNHSSRWNGFKGNLSDFVRSRGFKNVQSKHLANMPLQLIGLIGITEQYAESISLYNDLTGHGFKERTDNVNTAKQVSVASEEIKKLIAENNILDQQLYDFSCHLLKQRLAVTKTGGDWVYGLIDHLDESSVSGIAYVKGGVDAVDIDIYQGEILLAKIATTIYRPGYIQFGAPRNGFVGFSYHFDKETEPSSIRVLVASTGQELTKKLVSL